MRLPRIFVTLALGSLVGACSPGYYSPNTQNVLIAPERGDLLAAGVANADRLEVQAAYAITNAVVAQVNGGRFDPEDLENGDGGSGRFVEAGLGLFSSADEHLAWEMHVLLGVGSVEFHAPSTLDEHPWSTGRLEADVARVAFQPAIGFRSPFFETALSGRLARLRYTNVEGFLMYEGERQDERLQKVTHYLLAEPAVTVRAGLPHLKLQVQAIRSFNLTNREFRQDRSIVTVGVLADLPTR